MRRERELFDMAAEVGRETDTVRRRARGLGPKSMVEDNGDGTFTLPAWKAKELGFV
jgi:hypothetical protein